MPNHNDTSHDYNNGTNSHQKHILSRDVMTEIVIHSDICDNESERFRLARSGSPAQIFS